MTVAIHRGRSLRKRVTERSFNSFFPRFTSVRFFSLSRHSRGNRMKKIEEERKRRARNSWSLMRGARGRSARGSSRIAQRLSPQWWDFSRPRNDRVAPAARYRRERSCTLVPRCDFCMRDTGISARRASGSEKLHTHARVGHRSKRRDKTRIICGRRTVLNYRETIRTAAYRYRWPRGNSRIDSCRGADYGLTVQSSLWVSGFAKYPAELANESNWMSGKGLRTRRAIATVESDGKRRTRARKMITIERGTQR